MPKIVRFHQFGGPEVLQLDELPLQEPAEGEVRIKVHAIGLNRAEIMYHEEEYTVTPNFPSVIGYEAAGEVEAVGPGVDKFKVGDRVSVLPFDTNKYGSYGDNILMPVKYLTHIPENLSFRESAASWMQYMTAYGGLFGLGDLKSSDTVLVTGASSSAALGAIQMAKDIGATVIATTRGTEKVDFIKSHGADHVITTDYSESIVEPILELTNGKGINLSYDCIGGSFVANLCPACADNALFCVYGTFSPDPMIAPIFEFARRQLVYRFYSMIKYYNDLNALETARKYIFDKLEQGAFKPIIDDSKFHLDQIVEAQEYMKSSVQKGKILVDV